MAGSVYATLADLPAFGINPNATKIVDPDRVTAALSSASRRIDGYLRTRFHLPLLAWEDDIKEACCVLAVYTIMSARGFNPENGADINIRQRYKDQIDWLTAISKGTTIPGVTDSTPGATAGRASARPVMRSSSQRGWSSVDDPNGPVAPFQGD